MNKLGPNLKKLLVKSNLSENELSRRTGIPQQIINRILLGQNKNPKIATLIPLANYFMISISQLIGDEPISKEDINLNVHHAGWSEIPIIECNLIKPLLLNELISRTTSKILVDIPTNSHCFALKLQDHSMEPKFPRNALLTFEYTKKIINASFGLLYIHLEEKIVFRQIFIKQEHIYTKCLNPKLQCYKLKQIHPKDEYLGLLIQAKINYPQITFK